MRLSILLTDEKKSFRNKKHSNYAPRVFSSHGLSRLPSCTPGGQNRTRNVITCLEFPFNLRINQELVLWIFFRSFVTSATCPKDLVQLLTSPMEFSFNNLPNRWKLVVRFFARVSLVTNLTSLTRPKRSGAPNYYVMFY